jgi:hypothetical protein
MLINDDKTLEGIQAEFKAKFPFLKIEFYSGKHESGEGSPAMHQLDPSLTIGEARIKKAEGDFNIDPNMKVSELEGRFADKYGLNVQVFRKSGEIWLQTTATDSWTLADQNRKGGRSTLGLYEENED